MLIQSKFMKSIFNAVEERNQYFVQWNFSLWMNYNVFIILIMWRDFQYMFFPSLGKMSAMKDEIRGIFLNKFFCKRAFSVILFHDKFSLKYQYISKIFII